MEKGYLLDLELNHFGITPQNPIALVCRSLKESGQREPLPCYLVSVVGVHKLVVVDAVGRVTKDPLMRWTAAVERNDVVYKSLAGRREGK